MMLQETLKYLVDNGYVVQINKLFVFTAKFNREISGLDLGVVIKPKPEEIVVLEEVITPKEYKEEDWNVMYSDLIMKAKIPSHSYGAHGDTYEINRATKPGREAFKKAMIKEKLDLNILIQVVANYYKANNNRFRVKIETFFTSEMWRTDYDQLKATGKITGDNQDEGKRIKFG